MKEEKNKQKAAKVDSNVSKIEIEVQ